MNRRLDRYANFFRRKGNHRVAEWMDKLREHVNDVGGEAALAALGEDRGKGAAGEVQYGGADVETQIWQSTGDFIEAYLDRNGIVPVPVGQAAAPNAPYVSSVTARGQRGQGDPYLAADFVPAETGYANKLEEAKDLPGLGASEDVGVVMGRKVSHVTPDVVEKMDQVYGKGQWIIKAYGPDVAAAGFGIYFPQRIAQISQDARNTLWASGGELAKYGFGHLRDASGKVVGIKHRGGEEYHFGTEKYNATIGGDARHWADKAAAAADSERGAALPDGGKDFMAQPAFKAAGVSDAERAAGRTIAPGEGRTHVVTRGGKVEAIPHTTWIKGESLPVVFEDEDTKAMARAATEAINALPPHQRAGQVYAPDIVKTESGDYEVIELNASVEAGGSGYLGDNPLIMDAYVSHLTGREPGHVRFIRGLLTSRRGGKGARAAAQMSRAGLRTLLDVLRRGQGVQLSTFDPAKHPRGQPANAGQFAAREGFHPVVREEGGSYRHAAGHELPAEHAARLKALRLPPAWANVQLSADPAAPLQAVGTDTKGREQRVYSAEHSAKAAAEKFARVKAFVAELPALDERLRADLAGENAPAREAAACLLLIRKTGFRVGSGRDTGAEKEALGATTLTAANVRTENDTVRFDFVGKKGVHIVQAVADAELAAVLAPRLAAGGKLFQTTGERLREYLRATAGAFKPKDLRTVVAAEAALAAMNGMGAPATAKEFAKARAAVGKAVAAKLGNTPAVALASYIPPEIFGPWQAKIQAAEASAKADPAPAKPSRSRKSSKPRTTSGAPRKPQPPPAAPPGTPRTPTPTLTSSPVQGALFSRPSGRTLLDLLAGR